MSDEIMEKKKWWASSVESKELSLTIKGILIGLIPLAVLISAMFGANVPAGDWSQVVNGIEGLVIIIGSVISGIITLYGLIRKIIAQFAK